jgi:hypothetical protein
MTTHSRLITATLFATSALALSSPPALARIVCNDQGQCWRVHGHYEHRPDWGWREQEGRGYWHGGHGYGYWHGGHGEGDWHVGHGDGGYWQGRGEQD